MTIKSAVKVLVPVALMAFCASFVQARPAVDASPDRAKYRVQLYGWVKIPGESVWVPGPDAQMKFIGTLRPVLHRAEVAAQGQVAGGLDAGEHSLLLYDFFHSFRLVFGNFQYCTIIMKKTQRKIDFPQGYVV